MKSISRSPPLKLIPLAGRLDGIANDLLRQVHHRFVIGISPIEFNHRELRVMLGADPFVAIDTTHFVDAFDTADHQSLEVQLKSNSQIQLHVERVVVRHERLGCRTARDRVQRWSLDLNELVRRQRRADRMNDLGSLEESLQRIGVVRQIDVPHSLSQLGILQSGMLLRWWLKRLGHEVQPGCDDGQFAGIGTSKSTINSDQIAEVQEFGQIEIGVRHLAFGDHDLDVAGPVANIEKEKLARGSQ